MPSGSRGSVVTTSGWPHGQRWPTSWIARGSRPSWAATAASSAGSITGASRPGPRCRWPAAPGGAAGRRRARVDSQTGPHHASGSRSRTSEGSGRSVSLSSGLPSSPRTTYDVCAGHQVAEPLPRLCLDVGRVVPAALLALEVVDAGRALGDLRLEVGDVGPLLEVGPQRGGVGDGEHGHHEDQDRGAAGEPGPALPGGGPRPRPRRARDRWGVPRPPGRRLPPGPPRALRRCAMAAAQPPNRGKAAAPA